MWIRMNTGEYARIHQKFAKKIPANGRRTPAKVSFYSVTQLRLNSVGVRRELANLVPANSAANLSSPCIKGELVFTCDIEFAVAPKLHLIFWLVYEVLAITNLNDSVIFTEKCSKTHAHVKEVRTSIYLNCQTRSYNLFWTGSLVRLVWLLSLEIVSLKSVDSTEFFRASWRYYDVIEWDEPYSSML